MVVKISTMSVIQESETGFTISNLVFQGIVQLVTLPYHRFFTNNTLRPILELEKHAKNGLDPTSVEWAKLISLVTGWQARKKDELGFVSLTVRLHQEIPKAGIESRG